MKPNLSDLKGASCSLGETPAGCNAMRFLLNLPNELSTDQQKAFRVLVAGSIGADAGRVTVLIREQLSPAKKP